MKRRIHYRTWTNALTSYVATATESNTCYITIRTDGFVQIDERGEGSVWVPIPQIVAFYEIDEHDTVSS